MLQMATDKKNAELIQEIFSTDGIALYDNSLLVKSIISLLQSYFPKNGDFCEIEHYLFECGGGKIGSDSEWETPQKLYKRLCIERTFNQI